MESNGSLNCASRISYPKGHCVSLQMTVKIMSVFPTKLLNLRSLFGKIFALLLQVSATLGKGRGIPSQLYS